LIEAQRAAGEALAGTLKEQLKPSALRPALPAAKAALEALMQNKSSAAAAISIVNLMARSSPKLPRSFGFPARS
jgi:ABC-type arginine/histidine transport system permease subunit